MVSRKRMLVEDKKEVRLLQEMLFEDGDLHSDGGGRKRVFRWSKNGIYFLILWAFILKKQNVFIKSSIITNC